ncbi:hypothetical protein [Compostimonas suwonensis]|uniref:Uncharacterized protein n=1 Tax=Compostimonas suwonensis TaxID=1048394 RepID=A0A2M9BC93_9MICO|nr:hypothetical protein [Compostimonas suwonensis]PJJ55585.1 hypothetical protein CLV54_2932 [Compostimonas suwonensis]
MPNLEQTTFPFWIVFTIAAVVIAAVIVIVIISVVRSTSTVRRAGHDPFTLQAELASRALDSRLLAKDAPIEERLAELDRLRTSGAITEPELARARADVLRGR